MWNVNIFILCLALLAPARQPRAEEIPMPPFVPPLFYVHVPNSGSVIVATMLLFECPPGAYNYSGPPATHYDPEAFLALPGNAECRDNFERFAGGYRGVPVTLHPMGVVMMMRMPLPRVVSGFFSGLHGCPSLQARARNNATDALLLDYATCVKGLVTAMLGANHHAGREDVPIVTERVVTRAVEVVENAFFVGLTENYVCSVLLLNSALFGHDTVHDMQIEPYRVGNGSSVSAKRARVVLLAQGFVNVHDELLYDHARRRLWQCDL